MTSFKYKLVVFEKKVSIFAMSFGENLLKIPTMVPKALAGGVVKWYHLRLPSKKLKQWVV
jgi:hypothetical protein